MKEKVLLILMVLGLQCWGNTTTKRWDELMFKKDMFLIRTNSFPFNVFQEIYAITAENNEIVGVKPSNEKLEVKNDIPTKTGGDPVKQFFGKKPKIL